MCWLHNWICVSHSYSRHRWFPLAFRTKVCLLNCDSWCWNCLVWIYSFMLSASMAVVEATACIQYPWQGRGRGNTNNLYPARFANNKQNATVYSMPSISTGRNMNFPVLTNHTAVIASVSATFLLTLLSYFKNESGTSFTRRDYV